MRAPGDLGKATTMPGVRPTPPSSSMPCVETWWGLPLQWTAGTQATLSMRTLVTCDDALLLLVALGPPLLVVVVPPAACVPPGLDAIAGSAREASRHSAATAVAAMSLDRLWAPVLAKTSELLRAEPPSGRVGENPQPDRRPPTLSTMACKPRDATDVPPSPAD